MAAFVLFAHPLSAQIPAGDEALAGGFHQLYDLDFAGAQKAFALYQVSNPEDPRGQVAVATGLLFAEFHRLGVLESQFFTDDAAFWPVASFRPILHSTSASKPR